jgi:chromosome segregation ATPase
MQVRSEIQELERHLAQNDNEVAALRAERDQLQEELEKETKEKDMIKREYP